MKSNATTTTKDWNKPTPRISLDGVPKWGLVNKTGSITFTAKTRKQARTARQSGEKVVKITSIEYTVTR